MLKEMLFSQAMLGSGGGGGSKVQVVPLDVTLNGTYDEGTYIAFSPVTVNVSPNYPEATLVIGNVSHQSTTTKLNITKITTRWDSTTSRYYLVNETTSITSGQSRTYSIPIYPEGEAVVQIDFESFKEMSGDISVLDESKGLYRITGNCWFSAYGNPT